MSVTSPRVWPAGSRSVRRRPGLPTLGSTSTSRQSPRSPRSRWPRLARRPSSRFAARFSRSCSPATTSIPTTWCAAAAGSEPTSRRARWRSSPTPASGHRGGSWPRSPPSAPTRSPSRSATGSTRCCRPPWRRRAGSPRGWGGRQPSGSRPATRTPATCGGRSRRPSWCWRSRATAARLPRRTSAAAPTGCSSACSRATPRRCGASTTTRSRRSSATTSNTRPTSSPRSRPTSPTTAT